LGKRPPHCLPLPKIGSAQESVGPHANGQLPPDRPAAGRSRLPVKGARPPVESELGPLTRRSTPGSTAQRFPGNDRLFTSPPAEVIAKASASVVCSRLVRHTPSLKDFHSRSDGPFRRQAFDS